MKKTILVAGKEIPAGNEFAEGFLNTDRNVVVNSNEPVDAPDEASDAENNAGSENLAAAEWNKASSLSARSLVLQTENCFEKMDEAVLYFDEEYASSAADKMDASECSKTCDELILSFQYLALEILARFEKKNAAGSRPGKLVFLLKECPSAVDCIHSPVLRNGSKSIATPVISSAASAFAAFAENIAAVYGDMPYVNVVLVRTDKKSDGSDSDASLSQWLGSYLDQIDELKHKLTAKKSVQWVKNGAKNPGGFSLFK